MLNWKNALALPAVLLVALGCGGKADGPKTAVVKGTVKLGDGPLPTGKIAFDEGPTVPAVELAIKDGKYEGPVTLGKKTVRITAMKAGKAPAGMAGMPGYENGVEVNYLPAKYNTQSKETREVKDGSNEFDFKVTDK